MSTIQYYLTLLTELLSSFRRADFLTAGVSSGGGLGLFSSSLGLDDALVVVQVLLNGSQALRQVQALHIAYTAMGDRATEENLLVLLYGTNPCTLAGYPNPHSQPPARPQACKTTHNLLHSTP